MKSTCSSFNHGASIFQLRLKILSLTDQFPLFSVKYLGYEVREVLFEKRETASSHSKVILEREVSVYGDG